LEMRVKRFQAPSMQEALEKVREDLGVDAIILSTRKVRKASGPNALFEELSVEITAGLENTISPELNKAENILNGFGRDKAESCSKTMVMGEQHEIKRLRKEMEEIRQDLQKFGKRHTERDEPATLPLSIPEAVANSYRFLRSNGINDRAVVSIVNKLQKKMEQEKHVIPNMEMLLPIIQEGIPTSGPIGMGKKNKVVALVGPTGVGKTTTIAKLAANYSLHVNKKVALFTLDTYRVAAVEQLKVYAHITGIPLEVIEKPEDLNVAFSRHTDKDLILIDTSGISQKNTEQIKSLKSFIDVVPDIEVHLLMSSTTETKTMYSIVDNFSVIPISSLIFTKIDEGFTFGNLLNTTFKYKIPVSYLTCGQDVPKDIEPANARNIAWLVLYPNQRV